MWYDGAGCGQIKDVQDLRIAEVDHVKVSQDKVPGASVARRAIVTSSASSLLRVSLGTEAKRG